MNTSIIISELSREDFLKSSESLSLVDQIKLSVLNVDENGDEDYYLNQITTWSNLSFLNRIIIILKDEISSNSLYEYLKSHRTELKLHEDVKITLQPNLLQRSKSFDGKIDDDLFVNDLKKFKANNRKLPRDIQQYDEPTPQKFDYKDLSKLGIDVNELNEPKSKDDFDIRPSDTKTLFKPQLNVDTRKSQSGTADRELASPTITLDESN